jgi:hypothetical protein
MSSYRTAPRPCRICRADALAALLAVAAGLAAAPAAAQSSPYYVAGSLALTHDANLLRLAGDQTPGDGESRSDVVTSTALVGGINQGIGRQRVYGSLTLRDNRFQHNDKYNNQSYNGSLGLDWSTVERVSGTLALSAARALSTFNAEGVGLLPQKNLETTQAANAAVRIGVVTAYSVELGIGQRRVRNSLDDPRVKARDFNQDSVSIGLSWRPGGALSLSAALRDLKGEYPKFRSDTAGAFESDRFKQQQIELVSTWQPTGASGLDLRLNFGDTKYVDNDQRNFNSVNGSLGWLWQATGKLRLNTRYSRDKGQDAYPSSVPFFFTRIPVTLFDSRTVDTWRLQAEFEATAKVALTSSVQVARRKLSRDTFTVVSPTSLGTSEGTDSTTLFTLGVRWAPWRTTLFGCDASSERRKASGQLSANLQGAALACYGQLTLQ